MIEIERAIEKKEYIERGAALELFWEYSGNWNLINAIPDADVEPVVRGEWKWYDRKEAEIYAPLGMVVCAESYVCSNCGKYIGRSSSRDYRPKYCDNCGAHMERSGSGE